MLRKIFITKVKSSNVIIGSTIKVILCKVCIVLSALDISSTTIFLMLFRKNMKGGSFVAGDSSCPDALVLPDTPRYWQLPTYSFPPLTFLSPSQSGSINPLKSLTPVNFRQPEYMKEKYLVSFLITTIISFITMSHKRAAVSGIEYPIFQWLSLKRQLTS